MWRDAVLAVLDSDFERATVVLATLGHVDEGYARSPRGGRVTSTEGRPAEAETELGGRSPSTARSVRPATSARRRSSWPLLD